jgi:membrane protein implicated in regulation of membrane protease activity
MHRRRGLQGFGWRARVVALCLILALVPGCQFSAAQIYIPLAYGLTGTCIALLMSPTPLAAVVGFAAGVLLGAAVYNNSLKRQLSASRGNGPPSDPR